jgi:hypothetical protein
LSHPATDHGVRPVLDRSLPASARSGGFTRRCSFPASPKWLAATTCFHLLGSEDPPLWRSAVARSSSWRGHPSKVFPRSQPSLVACCALAWCVP